VKRFAKGQVYTGRRAKELKLVDDLGDLTVAKQKTEELAGIKDARLVRRPYLGWKRIFRFLNQKSSFSNILGEDRFSGLAYIYKQ
jgi:ClpP class serine protease